MTLSVKQEKTEHESNEDLTPFTSPLAVSMMTGAGM